MPDDFNYYKVELPRIKAIVGIDIENMNVKTIDCDNYEICYYSNVLEGGRCPKYCMVIVEAKHFALGRRKPRARIHEVDRTEIIDKLNAIVQY